MKKLIHFRPNHPRLRSSKSLVSLILALILPALLFISPVQGQDTVTTRTVRGKDRALGSEVVINQIDTSEFPKVTIFATVLRDGSPQQGLTASDFRVREDEVDQEPLTVVPKLSPLSVVVALDVSGSMKKALAEAQRAAIDFIQTLDEKDDVLALTFARQVKEVSSFSEGKERAKQSLRQTVARGDTALYDALYSSVEALKERTGRKAIVLLSDGVDDDGYGKQLSKHSVAEVLELSRSVNVPIYSIGLGTEIDEEVLSKVAENTGARYYNAPHASQLSELYESIGKELSGQYNIYYNSNLPADGSTHRVSLTYDKLTGIKEYLAPKDQRAVQINETKPEPKEVQAPKDRSVKLSFGLGTVIIRELNNQVIDVIREKKEVGYFSKSQPEQKLPAGDYFIKFERHLHPLRVEGGQRQELPLATLIVPGLDDQNIGVFLAQDSNEKPVKVGDLGEYSAQLKLPAGEYVLYFSKYPHRITLKEGDVLELPLATVKAPKMDEQNVEVYKDNYNAGYFGEYHSMLRLPAGDYVLAFEKYNHNISLKEGEDIELPLATVKFTGLKDERIAVLRDGKKVGLFLWTAPQIVLPAGTYQLSFDDYGTKEITVEERETLTLSQD